MHVTNSKSEIATSTNGRGNARPEPLAYSIADAAIVCSLSRSRLYELLKTGELPSIKIGGRRLITRAALLALLDRGSC